MRRRWFPAFTTSAALSLLACWARAETSIRWAAPASCPSESDVIRGVETMLGQPLSTPRNQDIAISADVKVGSTFAVALRIATEHGSEERKLEHESCSRLAEAAELVMALAIDPERVKQQQLLPAPDASSKNLEPLAAPSPPLPPPAAEPAPGAVPALAPTSQREAAPTPAKSTPWTWQLAASGVVGGGMLPRVGPGVEAELSLDKGRFGLALRADDWWPRSVAVSGTAASVIVQLMSVGARVCAHPLLAPLTVSTCAAVDVGDMHGTGEGVDAAHGSHARWSAAGVGVAARYPATPSHLAAKLAFDAGSSLDRPVFGVRRGGQDVGIFQPDALLWRAGLGLELQL